MSPSREHRFIGFIPDGRGCRQLSTVVYAHPSVKSRYSPPPRVWLVLRLDHLCPDISVNGKPVKRAHYTLGSAEFEVRSTPIEGRRWGNPWARAFAGRIPLSLEEEQRKRHRRRGRGGATGSLRRRSVRGDRGLPRSAERRRRRIGQIRTLLDDAIGKLMPSFTGLEKPKCVANSGSRYRSFRSRNRATAPLLRG